MHRRQPVHALLADKIQSRDVTMAARRLHRVGAPSEAANVNATKEAYLAAKHLKNIATQEFELKETGNLDKLNEKSSQVLVRTKMLSDVQKGVGALAPVPKNAALANLKNSDLVKRASTLKKIVAPKENLDAVREAFNNDNKVLRDISKRPKMLLKPQKSLEEIEKGNEDATKQGFLSDNKLFKAIESGDLPKLKPVHPIEPVAAVSKFKLLVDISKAGSNALKKNQQMGRVATELELKSKLPLASKNLKHVAAPQENTEALKAGYKSVNKVFKEIAKGDTTLKKTIRTKTVDGLTQARVNASIKKGAILKKIPIPQENFEAVKEAYLAEKEAQK